MKKYIPQSQRHITPKPPRPPARANINIVQALQDKLLLGAALGDTSTWTRWIAVLKSAFHLRMNDTDLASFKEVAGNREPPTRRVDELWCVVGRRSGKTRLASAISVYIAAIERHKLSPGEVGYVLLLAASRDQASVAFEYVRGFLRSSPLLRQQIVSETAHEVRLKGNIVIGVHAGSYRTVRGRTLLAIVADETSFWRSEESALPDTETYRAVLPALAASKGMWIGISTGYRKLGLLYTKWRDHFGQNSDDVLVVQGASTQFNATLDQAMIDRAKASDPEASEAEWMGGWRSDIAAFLDDAIIERCTDYSRPLEIPPRQGLTYSAFVDSSGGRHDHFCVCIGHKEGFGDGAYYVADVVRGRAPPFDPAAVVEELATLLKDYRVHTVTGDAYGAEWVSTAFTKQGIRYIRSELNKSMLYLEALPLFMRQNLSIPNHPRLIRELRLLERRTSRMGREVVDHGVNGSDDYANALCGCFRCMTSSVDLSMAWVGGDDNDSDNKDGRQSHAVAMLCSYLASRGIAV